MSVELDSPQVPLVCKQTDIGLMLAANHQEEL